MKTITDDLNMSSTTMNADLNSDGVWVGQALNVSISVVWTGTPTGTMKIQCSNEAGDPNNPVESARDNAIVNWIDVPSASTSISGAAGSAIYQVPNCSFNWIRLFYDNSSSTGTITSARICIKGF